MHLALADSDSFEQLRLERRHDMPVEHSRRMREPVRHAGPVAESGVWSVTAGADLRETLQSWCARQGYELVWKSDFNYQMTSGAAFRGSFEDAVQALVGSMKDVRPAPIAKIYQGNHNLVFSNSGASLTD